MQPLNLEQSLVKEGIISQSQLQTLKLEKERSAVSLVKALRRLNFVPEDALIEFLCKKLDLKTISLASFNPVKDLVNLLPSEYVWREKALPLFKEGNDLAVAVLDPTDVSLLEDLRFRTGMFIKPYIVKEEELNNLLSQYHDRRREQREASAQAAADKNPQASSLEAAVKEEGTKPSVVEAVDLLVLQAIKFNASDIHIEPLSKDRMRLRLRIDGVLKEISPQEGMQYNAIVSRLKIMSNLDIAEKRQPQDGRLTFTSDEGTLDVRISVIPTIQGESIVMRLLRQSKKLLTLEELGMGQAHLKIYSQLIYRPSGIILVTGPTGSGKTTTLYASLTILKSVEKNIITIEDPVEYNLDFCRQIQVNPKVNLTFAAGLRSVLRHDPDIIMVGEIRDLETATIAIQSALTGHLVFSTLHTNDAVSAITRLVDMGIEPFLIASCLNGVVAQRLTRVLCPKCKKKSSQSIFKESPFLDKAIEVYEAAGCQDCLNTGYAGRLGIFEIMEMAPEIGRMTVEKSSARELNTHCRKQGMKSLWDDGWDKVAKGLTSPQELMRVLGTGYE